MLFNGYSMIRIMLFRIYMLPTISDLLFLFAGDFGKEDPTSSKGKQHA